MQSSPPSKCGMHSNKKNNDKNKTKQWKQNTTKKKYAGKVEFVA